MFSSHIARPALIPPSPILIQPLVPIHSMLDPRLRERLPQLSSRPPRKKPFTSKTPSHQPKSTEDGLQETFYFFHPPPKTNCHRTIPRCFCRSLRVDLRSGLWGNHPCQSTGVCKHNYRSLGGVFRVRHFGDPSINGVAQRGQLMSALFFIAKMFMCGPSFCLFRRGITNGDSSGKKRDRWSKGVELKTFRNWRRSTQIWGLNSSKRTGN